MDTSQDMLKPGNILLVDDNVENLHLLVALLGEQGYQVRALTKSTKVISVAQAKPPDLILLDIMMPELDGYDVCRQLKATEQTHEIPVIFISALQTTFDKIKAFSVGGVDYITKPFEPEEVLARVETHLSLHRMQQQLQVQNVQLQQEITKRKQVEEILRETSSRKDIFFSILAHDLRSPFTALLGNAELALHYLDKVDREDMRELLSQIHLSAENIYALLENLLTWARFQRGITSYHPTQIAVYDVVAHVLQLFSSSAEQKQIALHNSVPQAIQGYADSDMVHTIIRNLVSNALKFTSPGGTVDVTARQDGGTLELRVSDTGIGIPESNIRDLFQIGAPSTTSGTSGERGTGLGLPLCRDLVQKHGGSLWVHSEPGQGSTFIFTLPSSNS